MLRQGEPELSPKSQENTNCRDPNKLKTWSRNVGRVSRGANEKTHGRRHIDASSSQLPNSSRREEQTARFAKSETIEVQIRRLLSVVVRDACRAERHIPETAKH